MKALLHTLAMSLPLLLISVSAHAAWTLQPESSRLSFVSIKNNTVAEAHRFTKLSGSVADDGKATLSIALDSVETGIPIRTQRLREVLFETAKFPKATATLKVDLKPVEALAVGAHLIVQSEVSLDLHGVSNRLPAELRITRLGTKQWLVTSEQPLLVNATNHGLINGIDSLRKLAGLQSIGSGIPVTLTLSFKQP